MTAEPAVVFRDLEVGYGRFRVAGPLSGRFDAGRLWALTGPNGSGKTTLLRTLIGLDTPLAGSVDRPSGLVVNYVPQIDALDPAFPVNVAEVVGMGIRGRNSRSDRNRIREALATVGLQGKERHLFRHLSGGQRQRALVARALITDTGILALDEPTSGIDADGSTTLWKLLTKCANANRIVMVSTHDHLNVEHHADGVFDLSVGAIRECHR